MAQKERFAYIGKHLLKCALFSVVTASWTLDLMELLDFGDQNITCDLTPKITKYQIGIVAGPALPDILKGGTLFVNSGLFLSSTDVFTLCLQFPML